ncbi:MAG: response regulator, partial [Ilumatobacteraceae bacterium]
LLNSLSDEVNVITTKAGTSTDTEFTAGNFNSLMQTVVFGHDPITGAALLERPPSGGGYSTTAISDYGPEFEAGLIDWVQNPANERLSLALAGNGVSFVGIASLPVPAGGMQPHFVYYASLLEDSSSETTRSIIATVSIPILLARSLSLALGSNNEVTVTLYQLGIDTQEAVWTSNSALSAQRLTTNLAPVEYNSGLGKSASASRSVDDLAFDLVVERGERFGTPLTTRRLLNLVISLGGLGLCASLLQVNNDRARRESDRRRRESLLAAALEGAPGWTAVIDEDDHIVVANTHPAGVSAGSRLVDAPLLDADEVTAQRVVDLVDRARHSTVEPITVTQRRGRPGHGVASDDEDMRIYEVLARRIGDPDPDNLVFLQATDVTERRELAMRHAQSERMESIGVLAGSLAHDFNNLLFITQGYLQMMERQPQVANDSHLSRFVSRASEAVQRGATIAKSLLAVARSQPMAAVPINMRQFLDDLDPLIRQAISTTTNITLSVEVLDGTDGSPATDSGTAAARRDELDVLVDPGRMSSALLNLVFNARDAMEHGGTMLLRAERKIATDDEGNSREVIALSVRDTGQGMSPEVAARVRALVVDVEETLADLVASWLEELGFEARVATNSAAAFTIAQEFQPQLLLSDSNLGEELDGADVAARLSSDLSGLITVFMTGYSDWMRSLETVGAMILAKPFSRDDLSAALIKVLGARFQSTTTNGSPS